MSTLSVDPTWRKVKLQVTVAMRSRMWKTWRSHRRSEKSRLAHKLIQPDLPPQIHAPFLLCILRRGRQSP
jgi:hypothetical protein